MKVVIKVDFGGFALSPEAFQFMGLSEESEIDRADPRLVSAVETLGVKVNGFTANLAVREVTKSYYFIIEYDGAEAILVSDSPITWNQ